MNKKIFGINKIKNKININDVFEVTIYLAAGWYNIENKWNSSDYKLYYITNDVVNKLPLTIRDIIKHKEIIQWLRKIPNSDVNFNIDLTINHNGREYSFFNTINQVDMINLL
jgi:hypothetical protein